MKAMIFAAGLGTRLYPVTEVMPKALVEVGGEPLLGRVIRKLAASGIREMVVNVHHFAPMIIDYIHSGSFQGVKIHISDESDCLLNTGGGVMKAARLLRGDGPVLLHNVDIISDLDIGTLTDYHLRKGGVATVVVRERETQRYFLFNQEMRLTGWINRKTGEKRRARADFPDGTAGSSVPPWDSSGLPSRDSSGMNPHSGNVSPRSGSGMNPGSGIDLTSRPGTWISLQSGSGVTPHSGNVTSQSGSGIPPDSGNMPSRDSSGMTSRPESGEVETPLAFSGIHIVDPLLFDIMPLEGHFSLVDAYLEITGRYPVFGYHDFSQVWLDVGKPDQLREAENLPGIRQK